ncbi:unnamed protein product [Notodromas monacha]|uniref:Uncharacterized protein n=1 Tax=Notodromas monacha TaxID=399045 RepID=A0A7R9BEV6_9CRUS|nr:unnamed protein product [Notodromas monacha]CAG0912919.1 unnamed protein product [Notodromas monacha]
MASRERLFTGLKSWEVELLEYARQKHPGMPKLHSSKPNFCPVPVSSQSSATFTSNGQSYRAQTLSSFAKSSRPMRGHSDPLTSVKNSSTGKCCPRQVASESDFTEESASDLCRKLSRVSSELCGIVGEITDDQLRDKVARFCDEIGGYVSEERLRGSSNEILASSAMQKQLEQIMEIKVAVMEENRRLAKKIGKLEEQLKRTERNEVELKTCVEKLREKPSGISKLEKEMQALKEDNKRMKDQLQAVMDSNKSLQKCLQEREAEMKDFKMNSRKMVEDWMHYLELTACKSASQLTVSSKPSVGRESNGVRILVTKSAGDREPKTKANRVEKSVSAIASTSTVGFDTCRSASVRGMEADAESESDSEALSTDTDHGLHSDFQTNLQEMHDHMNKLKESLGSRLH